MKKQKKQLLVLILVLLALILAAAGIYLWVKQQEETQNGEEASGEIYRAQMSDITEISCEAGNEQTLHLVKQGDQWISPEHSKSELDKDAVDSLASQLSNICASRVLEDVDIKEYGFDNPLGKVTIISKGQEISFTIGMKNEVTGEYYLIRDDDPSRIFVTDDEMYLLTQKTVENYEMPDADKE